jgi:cell fate (sporulation/competence/biofilm development) regulator YmcA (YheA/YmcA/DUF963 family)
VAIGGLAYWLHTRTVAEMSAAQAQELAAMRSETNQQLQAAADLTRTQIEDLNRLLSDAISQRQSELFFNDQELAAANADRIDTIATALAAKIQPFDDLPSSPEEAARRELAQIDQVADRLNERLEPLLAELSDDTEASRETLAQISAEISDQLSTVLTQQIGRNQALHIQLSESHAIARDTMVLAQEFGSLYVASKDNDGMLTRLLMLPADMVKDVSKGSIITSTERKKIEEELAVKMSDLQDRLNELDPEGAHASEETESAEENSAETPPPEE